MAGGEDTRASGANGTLLRNVPPKDGFRPRPQNWAVVCAERLFPATMGAGEGRSAPNTSRVFGQSLKMPPGDPPPSALPDSSGAQICALATLFVARAAHRISPRETIASGTRFVAMFRF